MNQIAPLLPAANIMFDLDAGSKTQLFAAVGRLFERNRGLRSDLIVDSLVAREKLGSTGLGQGIAIPHGRIKGLAEAQGAFARLRAPIAFDAPDGKPVAQVFVLLVPEHATEQHLQLLSELAQMFSEKMFRERLAAAADADAIHSVFAEWENVG
jgi:PTS system nitrogen regulatory IIA component